jgi:hypothetical protein
MACSRDIVHSPQWNNLLRFIAILQINARKYSRVMIHARTHHLHLDPGALPHARLWRLAMELQTIIVGAAAGGSAMTAIPPLLALAINGLLGLRRRSFQNPEQ